MVRQSKCPVRTFSVPHRSVAIGNGSTIGMRTSSELRSAESICYAPFQECTFSEYFLLRKCHARPVA
jgi:hypothetical protein